MNLLSRPCQHAFEDTQTSNTATITRILIVDDEASICDFIAEVLNESNFTADKAASAGEALRMLQDRHYDVLLTDYHMPKMTGSELISKLRSDGIDIPVVLMTGQRDELLARYPDLQVNAVLGKPFMIEEMLDVLARVLRPVDSGGNAASRLVDLALETHESRRKAFL
jgi:two-component system OmpR family response regulator